MICAQPQLKARVARIIFLILGNILIADLGFSMRVELVNDEKLYAKVKNDDETTVDLKEVVCFRDESGSDVGCGKVAKIKDQTIFVKFPKKLKEQIRVGFEAYKKNASGNREERRESDVIRSKTKAKISSNPVRIEGFYFADLMMPLGFSTLKYIAPSLSQHQKGGYTKLWEADQRVEKTNISPGLGMEIGFPLGSSVSMSLGFAYEIFSFAPVETDYVKDTTFKNQYVSILGSGSSIVGWLDLYFYSRPFTFFILRLGSGFEYLKNSYSQTSELNNEKTSAKSDFTSIKSSMSVMSLRLPLSFDLVLGKHFGANFTVIPRAPLSASSAATTVDGTADPHTSQIPSLEENVTSELNHKKTSFALALKFGVSLFF